MRDQNTQVIVRNVTVSDAPVWEALRRNLWPDGAEDHAPEIANFFAGTAVEPIAVLVAETNTGAIVGFAELSIRIDVAGIEGMRVGYVEGLYVTREVRDQGIARKLLQASRGWARQQNCSAFASDRAGRVVIDNSYRTGVAPRISGLTQDLS